MAGLRLRRLCIPGLALVAGALALVIGQAAAQSDEALANSGFESWPISPPWQVVGSATAASSPAIGSYSAMLSGQDAASLTQVVSATGGTTYSASVQVAADSGNEQRAWLHVRFMDASMQSLHTATARDDISSQQFQTLSLQTTAPSGSALARFTVELRPRFGDTAHGWVDAASLVGQAPPSPTPTFTPTATPTPLAASTPTATATSIPTSTPSPTATQPPPATVDPTNTPVPAATPTPAAPPPPSYSTPTPTPSPVSPPGGSSPPPSPTSTPPPAATPTPSVEPYGGLLQNGDFAQGGADGPAHWRRFGGTLERTSNAYRGDWAARHVSTTSSTKWIFQAVPVQPGGWYRANARARVEHGNAELFIRVSWYASTDGSGSYISQEDSPISTSRQWRALSTGAIQAPTNARSARVRLMLRPFGNTAGNWDDALFVATAPATPTPVPTTTPAPDSPGAPPDGDAPAPPSTPGGNGSGGPGSPGGSGSGPAGGSGSRPAGGSSTIQVSAGEEPQGGPLLLSEIMSDPDVAGENTLNEWVEVYNHTDEPVDLAGWMIADRGRGAFLPSLVVPPRSYAVIAARETALPGDVLSVRVPAGRIGYGLRNPGDAVMLFDAAGTLVDAMSYGDIDSYGPGQPDAPPKGETLGRDVEQDPPGPWQLTLRPTPGEANVFPAIEDHAPETPPPGDDPAPSPTPVDEVAGEAQESESDPADVPVAAGSGMSPMAWLVLGAAAGAGAVGAAPWLPAVWRRLNELKNRGR